MSTKWLTTIFIGNIVDGVEDGSIEPKDGAELIINELESVYTECYEVLNDRKLELIEAFQNLSDKLESFDKDAGEEYEIFNNLIDEMLYWGDSQVSSGTMLCLFDMGWDRED